MTKMRIACSALNKRIYLGRVCKDGRSFFGDKRDVTSDVLKAVIDKVGAGETVTVEADGKPAYTITIGKIE